MSSHLAQLLLASAQRTGLGPSLSTIRHSNGSREPGPARDELTPLLLERQHSERFVSAFT